MKEIKIIQQTALMIDQIKAEKAHAQIEAIDVEAQEVKRLRK